MKLRWPLVVLGLALITYFAARHFFQGVQKAVTNPLKLRITEEFTAAIPTLEPAGGMKLEVAVANATETFQRSDELTVASFSLGKTVTRISVPVTYRYHIQLQDKWRLEERDNVCLVHAPQIRATLPPAVHTDRMKVESSGAWLRLNGREQTIELMKTITPQVSRFAEYQSERDFAVRNAARQKVGEFVKSWILKDPKWRDRLHSVVVVFPDDATEDAARQEPVIVLDRKG